MRSLYCPAWVDEEHLHQILYICSSIFDLGVKGVPKVMERVFCTHIFRYAGHVLAAVAEVPR
jgi:hypothetical protein